MDPPCGEPILWGISPDFSGLSPCYRWIAYVLLTRAPVADRGIATSSLPLDLHVLGLSLAFILSQDQTLRCIFSFSLLYLRSVTWPNWLLSLLFPVLHLLLQFLQWTWQKLPGACPVSSFAVAKLMHFPIPLQIFLPIFYAVQHNFFYNELYYTHLYLNIFFKKIPILFKWATPKS